MAEETLDTTDIHPGLQQADSEGVAQAVRVALLFWQAGFYT